MSYQSAKGAEDCKIKQILVFVLTNTFVTAGKGEQQKELPVLLDDRRPGAFYERQINGLREELNTAEVEIDTHLEALEIAEDWHKRQKEELLEENKRLKEREKKMTAGELIDKMEFVEKEIKELKEQIGQLTNQLAQIETPPKEKGLKGFFKFGGKK